MNVTAEYVQWFLSNSAGIELPIGEAGDLVPLVRAQLSTLARLSRFDVSTVRPHAAFDPRDPYRA
jgi:hypothetical protein